MAATSRPNNGLAAQADEIMRALQDVDSAPPQMRGIDIIAALEMDPNLTLDDVLGSRPDPQTLAGTGPAPRARGELLPVPLPELPNSNAMPPGEGLQPQSRPEARELAQEASSFGQGANVAATAASVHPVGRAVSMIPKAVAAAPRAAAALAGGAALTAGAADAQAPGRDTSASAAALEQMLTQQQTLTQQRKALTDERATFAELSTPAQIRAAQERLNALGYDAGPPDGRAGGQWRGALQRYNADRVRELRELTEQINGIGPRISDAQKQVRLDQQAAEKEAGGRRLREMEEDVHPLHSLARALGPYAGALLGIWGGYAGRGKLGKVMGEISQKKADRADDLMTGSTAGGVPGRAARVNQFWTEGGGRPAPFTDMPRQRPYPYTPNPNAPPADTLYPPSAVNRWLPGPALAATAGAESLGGHILAVAPAREELAAAQEAVSGDPSEANIRRLQTARDKLAGAEFLSFLGRGAAGGVAAAEVKSQLRYTTARPNVSAADSERGNVTRLLQSQRSNTQERIPRGRPGGGRFKGE